MLPQLGTPGAIDRRRGRHPLEILRRQRLVERVVKVPC